MRISKIILSTMSSVLIFAFLCSCTIADFEFSEGQIKNIISQLEDGELDNIVSQLEGEIKNTTSQSDNTSKKISSASQIESDTVSKTESSLVDTESDISEIEETDSVVTQKEVSQEIVSSEPEVNSTVSEVQVFESQSVDSGTEDIDDTVSEMPIQSEIESTVDSQSEESVYIDIFDDYDDGIYEEKATESIIPPIQESNIYKIKTVEDLKEFANTVRCGHSYKGELVTLEADLDLAGIEWAPIGSYKKPFKGTFFANGHKISNLTITSLTEQMSDGRGGNCYVGFFGYAQDASISGLILENVNITLNGTADTEYVQVGSIVGYMMAVNDGITLSKCKASGNISVSIPGDRIVEIGGIAGGFDANYKDTSYNMYLVQSDVNITGEGFIYNMGGIASVLNSRDSNSSDSSIHDLIYKGNINDEKVKRSKVGGLFGVYNSGYRCDIKNCFVNLTLNRIGLNSYSELEPNQGIVIGDQCVSTSDLGLENIYGSINLNEKPEEMSMVGRTHGKVYYKNCIETSEIPESVEFEIKYWNLTDRSSPLFDLEYTK